MRSAFVAALALSVLSCQHSDLTVGDRSATTLDAESATRSGDSLAKGAEVVELLGLPDNHLYPGGRVPVLTAGALDLPLGAIQAKGWLRDSLHAQAQTLLDIAGKVAMDVGSPSVWLEDSPHVTLNLLRALTRLTHVVDGLPLRPLTDAWIKKLVDGQHPNGWIGPAELKERPPWGMAARVVQALRDAYTAAPRDDLLAALRKYFRFQSNWLKKHEPDLQSFQGLVDHALTILWLYNEEGDVALLELLLGIFKSIGRSSVEDDFRLSSWRDMHAMLEESDRTERAYLEMIGTWIHGEPGFVTRSVHYEELSSTIDSLAHSAELGRFLAASTGGEVARDASILLDRLADPELRDPVRIDGLFALATYVSRAWFATRGDGLVAVSYIPCGVRARVGEDEGTHVTLDVMRDRPTSDRVLIDLEAPRKVIFPLALRVPSNCDTMTVRVNGGAPISGEPGTYLALMRLWRPGDQVELTICAEDSDGTE